MMTRLSLKAVCVALLSMFDLQTQCHAALLTPDWNDDRVAQARDRLRALRSDEAQPSAPGLQEPSLPRWGFGNMRKPTRSDRAGARLDAAPSSSPLPACATETPIFETTPRNSDSWYLDSYDYGCIRLSVTGDRAYDEKQKFPDAPSASLDCTADLAMDAADDETDSRGRFEIQLPLNNIPYTIAGECREGAEDFCRDRRKQCDLVDFLILKGGTQR